MKKIIFALFVLSVLFSTSCRKQRAPIPQATAPVLSYQPAGCPGSLVQYQNQNSEYLLASDLGDGFALVYRGPNGPIVDNVIYYGGCSGQFECFYELSAQLRSQIAQAISQNRQTNPQGVGWAIVLRQGTSFSLVQ